MKYLSHPKLMLLRYPFTKQCAVDFFLALSCLYVSWRAFRDYQVGGQPYKQGDWLISNAGGAVRRGHFGSGIISISDFLGIDLLLTVFLAQVIALLILFAAFRRVITPLTNSSILLAISPAIFTVFWVADPGGSVRKELLAFAGLAMCALSTMRDSRLLLGVGVLTLCVSFVAHEAMVLFVPSFLGIIFLSGMFKTDRNRATVSCAVVLCVAAYCFYFAVAHAQAPDVSLVCSPLLARGLDPAICSGAIAWLGYDSAYGFRTVLGEINPVRLTGFVSAYIAALAPFYYLIRRTNHPMNGILVLLAAGLPFAPLYAISIDWGRWMSCHIFSAAIIMACALRHNKLTIREDIPDAHVFSFITVSLLVSPQHEIGLQLGGVLRQLSSHLWRIVG